MAVGTRLHLAIPLHIVRLQCGQAQRSWTLYAFLSSRLDVQAYRAGQHGRQQAALVKIEVKYAAMAQHKKLAILLWGHA